jgi:hypothetical protein
MLGPTGRTLHYPDGTTRPFALACGSCGVLLRHDADPAECRRDLEARLQLPRFLPDAGGGYGLDPYTLRTAATAFGRGSRPREAREWADLRAPHGPHAALAALFDLAPGRGGVSLGVLCRPADVAAVLEALPAEAGWTDEAVILVDAPSSPPEAIAVSGFPTNGVRLAARPLGEDFAGQRNALQDLGRSPWMLQLDADETLAPGTGALLPALVAMAEEGGAVSIGLPRRNLVDGVLSDMYPDVQYRLNRAALRYAGRVHERPEAGGWARGFIALHGAIIHRLEGAHVRARSRRYEAMDPGRGRLEEQALLLKPYAD